MYRLITLPRPILSNTRFHRPTATTSFLPPIFFPTTIARCDFKPRRRRRRRCTTTDGELVGFLPPPVVVGGGVQFTPRHELPCCSGQSRCNHPQRSTPRPQRRPPPPSPAATTTVFVFLFVFLFLLFFLLLFDKDDKDSTSTTPPFTHSSTQSRATTNLVCPPHCRRG
jgi:hypothetical protein